MYDKLQKLVDGKRIVAIDATPVPAPPQSRYPGDHLVVNCHYDAQHSSLPAGTLLHLARWDALAIYKAVAGEAGLGELVSVVATIYGHFPVAGASRPARRRIYCIDLLCSDIPADPRQIDSTLLTQVHVDENSQLDEITELMHQLTN